MEKFAGVEYSIGLNNSEAVFPLFAFGSIGYWAKLIQFKSVQFEVHENFIKQSSRSRYKIYGPAGGQTLSVLLGQKSSKSPLKDIQLSYDEPWSSQHLKALKTAYASSPFFEFYEDELSTLYSQKWEYLIDLNLASICWVIEKLDVQLHIDTTSNYSAETSAVDFRSTNKKEEYEIIGQQPYNQVFNDIGLPFIPHLSILDLLFNEGPMSYLYLKNQSKV